MESQENRQIRDVDSTYSGCGRSLGSAPIGGSDFLRHTARARPAGWLRPDRTGFWLTSEMPRLSFVASQLCHPQL